MKEKEIIKVNNMIKEDDEVSGFFGNNHWNKEFINKIDLNMNNNDYD